jgi:hypothetical protein
MNKSLIFSGFCPTLKKNYSIEVEYIDVSSLGSPNNFIQGLCTCNHHALNDCSLANECPIKAQAPTHRRF